MAEWFLESRHGRECVMATEERRSFGALLKHYRLDAGLTHEGLAGRSTLSPRTISDLERGISRSPRPETVALLIEALQLAPEQRAALVDAARPRTGRPDQPRHPARGPSNLPAQLTSFVGREREVRAVRDLLCRQDTRLVTLTGPGGVGKTRLGIQVAGEPRQAFPDGVFYVALAPASGADAAVQTIARVLGVSEVDGQARLAALIDALQPREPLLLLDNFEHLLDAAPLIAELLRACPRLRVLVTSRAALRLSGEQEFPVAPLPVPDIARVPPVDALASYAAVALFVERAARVRPDFTLAAGNAAPIAAICARLDGLPLALELAAARMKTLSPRALLARLEGNAAGASLRLLTGGARDLPARQQTLRNTIAWSYDVLQPDEQRLLRRAAVFAGGCTLEAAAAVCMLPSAVASPAGDLPAGILDGLTSLVDKSLMYEEDGPDGEPRFLMLETIREYASEQLVAHGEESALRRQHARYYLALVEATGAILFAAARERTRLAAEQDNIQTALRWLVVHGQPD
jgi:predicted ATPase/transcriptional regulator with XRE-family HTH domain